MTNFQVGAINQLLMQKQSKAKQIQINEHLFPLANPISKPVAKPMIC